ncbi:MAG: 50S ribosomal protein L16 [Zestosphaera tikiterensis]|uniref:Large ribosomal subunit protein uL16 n=1 Tax=Zestosphaera tikiterensis TaxID=1973259 RepID=A0A2R7Y5N8_9CREN|nr:MAG: 50S ribosomal protein L16 [Zestosphaera tikiterensis]
MPLRPARCYKDMHKPPYTRSEYIDGIPQPKITKYVMGNPHGSYDVVLELISLENVVIRHNSLEAGRVMANKYLSKFVGDDKFLLIIRQYPHHVLRENKMMAFAGADRLQDGMRQAFGKPVGVAARVTYGSAIAEIRTTKKYLEHAKEAMRRLKDKLGVRARIIIKELSTQTQA